MKVFPFDYSDAFYYWLKDTSFIIADSVHEVIKDCSTPEVLENCLTLLIILASYGNSVLLCILKGLGIYSIAATVVEWLYYNI